MLRWFQFENAVKGAADVRSTSHSAGVTCGIGKTIQYLGELSANHDEPEKAKPAAEKTAEELLIESWTP